MSYDFNDPNFHKIAQDIFHDNQHLDALISAAKGLGYLADPVTTENEEAAIQNLAENKLIGDNQELLNDLIEFNAVSNVPSNAKKGGFFNPSENNQYSEFSEPQHKKTRKNDSHPKQRFSPSQMQEVAKQLLHTQQCIKFMQFRLHQLEHHVKSNILNNNPPTDNLDLPNLEQFNFKK